MSAASSYSLEYGSVRENSDERADLDGDGRADLCCRGELGIYCALKAPSGLTFATPTLWHNELRDTNGWHSEVYFATIRYPDLDGDGKADICGRASDGILCALNAPDPSSGERAFRNLRRWSTAFNDETNGEDPASFSTLRYPDINGDKRADLCGVQRREVLGTMHSEIDCAANQSIGAPSFNPPVRMDDPSRGVNLMPPSWGTSPSEYTTVRFPDLDGDGNADMCARGEDGIYCGLKDPAAMSFLPITIWQSAFSNRNGWSDAPYYGAISYPDLNGDGRSDICGRASAGIYCALSTGGAFGDLTLWSAVFSDDGRWNQVASYTTIAYPDINADGKADICGRGPDGIHCGFSDGTTFGDSVALRTSDFSNTHNWDKGAEYYSTIMFRDIDGDGRADVCARGAAGFHCARYDPALSSGPTGPTGMFERIELLLPDFDDFGGWNSPTYFWSFRMP